MFTTGLSAASHVSVADDPYLKRCPGGSAVMETFGCGTVCVTGSKRVLV